MSVCRLTQQLKLHFFSKKKSHGKKVKKIMSKVTFKVIDFSGEYSNCSFDIPDVDETNWVATNTAVGTIQTALTALTAGNIARRSLQAYNVHVNDAFPAVEYAQRETGLRLFYKDTVNGEKFHVTIPAPDLALIAEEGSDDVDMSLSIVSTLTAAIEAVAVSRYGNPISFYKGTIIGRRN